MNELEQVTQAVEQELDRDFKAWFAQWATPAGVHADAPDPPKSRYTTSPKKIAQAALKAHEEWLEANDMTIARLCDVHEG